MKKYKIYIIAIVFALTIILGAILLSQKNEVVFINENVSNNITSESENKINDGNTSFYLTAIKGSHTAVVAEFKEFKVDGTAARCIFNKKEIIYGNAPEEEINVVAKLTRGLLNKNTFKEGEEYLLILRREETLFLPYATYSLMGEAIIPMNDAKNSTWSKGAIELKGFANSSDIVNAIKNMANVNGHLIENPPKIFRTEDMKTVAENCDTILKVSVDGVIAQGVTIPQYTYRCKSVECLKGEYNQNAEGYLFINAYPESMEGGKEYIVLLSALEPDIGESEEETVFYMQASPESIIALDSENADLIYEIIK